MNALAQRMEERVGFDRAAAPGVLESAIRRRAGVLGLDPGGEYEARAVADSSEFERLVEEAMVPETWFFRDVEPFACLYRYATEEWTPRPGRDRLRVLSLPCSTGEEPYSIAITLLRAGLSAERFQIEAVDVSRRALDAARAGWYSAASFREKEAPPAAPYFEERAGRRRVREPVRRAVAFRQANALDYAPADAAGFDIVFCRNLFIYLTAEARRRTLARLTALLHDGGLFFLGHAELPHAFLPTYTPMPPPGTFAARKPRAGEPLRS